VRFWTERAWVSRSCADSHNGWDTLGKRLTNSAQARAVAGALCKPARATSTDATGMQKRIAGF
jgi:predicted secreted hydrolase